MVAHRCAPPRMCPISRLNAANSRAGEEEEEGPPPFLFAIPDP